MSGIPLEKWNGSDAILDLHKTIIEIDKSTNKKTNIIILLTVITLIVTVIGLGVSFYK